MERRAGGPTKGFLFGEVLAIVSAWSIASCGGRTYESLGATGTSSAGRTSAGGTSAGGSASGGTPSTGGHTGSGGASGSGGVSSAGGTLGDGGSVGIGGTAGCSLPALVSSPWVAGPGRDAVKLSSCAAGSAIAVDHDWVYWASIDGTVAKAPTAGGDTITLVQGLLQLGSFNSIASAIAVDDKVYFATGGMGDFSSLQTVPLDGGPVTLLAKGGGQLAVAAKSGNVYFTDPGAQSGGGVVVMIPAGTGQQKVLFAGDPCGIAVDATSVYWMTMSGAIVKVPIGGGAASTLGTGDSLPECVSPAIASNGRSVYWLRGADGILQVPVDGGTFTTLSLAPSSARLAVDDSNAYWTDASTNVAVITKFPLGGGAPVALATLSGGAPLAIAVDDTSVYWTDPLASSITKLTPK